MVGGVLPKVGEDSFYYSSCPAIQDYDHMSFYQGGAESSFGIVNLDSPLRRGTWIIVHLKPTRHIR